MEAGQVGRAFLFLMFLAECGIEAAVVPHMLHFHDPVRSCTGSRPGIQASNEVVGETEGAFLEDAPKARFKRGLIIIIITSSSRTLCHGHGAHHVSIDVRDC